MTKPINGSTLKVLREKRGLSLKGLAGKSGISVSQIVRLESGSDRPPRATTLAGLSKALGVGPDQLTAEANTDPEPLSPKQQANFRIASSARNALGLVAMRYRVDPGDIVEAAPLLFHLFAEGSLKSRRDRLRLAEEKFAAVETEASGFPHLPKIAFLPRIQTEDAFAIEERSISDRDLFGDSIDKGLDDAMIDDDRDSYDSATDNPFVAFVRQTAGEWGVAADIEEWSAYSGPRFEICEAEAREFVGGDGEAARAILAGSAPLTELSDGLRKRDADPAKRAEWAKERQREWLRLRTH